LGKEIAEVGSFFDHTHSAELTGGRMNEDMSAKIK
jgi:hypothetical protein